MRGMGLFFGVAKRNDPVKLVDPRPLPDYGNTVETGDAGKDGFTVMSRADRHAQGNPPPVKGVVGPVYQGPDQSFEQ